MTDLLTRDEVRNIDGGKGGWQHATGWVYSHETVHRICRDYLTLWDELEHERELHDKAVKRVTQLEQEIGALMR